MCLEGLWGWKEMMEEQSLDTMSTGDAPRATQVDTSPSEGNGRRPVDPEVEPEAEC